MIKIIEKTKEKISFETDIEESLANAIRRSVLEIPLLAIDEIEFKENDSALYDEVLAHRLGLVPLIADKSIKEQEKCGCEGKGCNKCTVSLKLKAKGPCTVYSKELKGRANPVYENIPLVILEKGQELEFLAKAKLGKAVNHTKFSPGLVYYRNLAKIEIDKSCNKCKQCIEACPQKILQIEKDKVGVKNIYKCDLCGACVEACKEQGKESIKISKDNNLIFFIESWGQIKPEEIFKEAVESLKNNLKEIEKQIK
jgi:DNA-directed RNA polymerase subunit D